MIKIANLKNLLVAEQAAVEIFKEMSAAERQVYLKANSGSFMEIAANGSIWFKSLSPKQQKDYLKLHPDSHLAPGGGRKSADYADWEAHEKFNTLAGKLANIRTKELKAHPSHILWLNNLSKISKQAAKTKNPTVRQRHEANILKYMSKKLPVASTTKNKYASAMVESAGKKLGQFGQWNDNQNDDHDMHSMYANDAADHLKIATHLHKGNNKAAEKVRSDMDTSSRDDVPEHVFDYLQKVVHNR
jgi:hypothetical protein